MGPADLYIECMHVFLFAHFVIEYSSLILLFTRSLLFTRWRSLVERFPSRNSHEKFCKYHTFLVVRDFCNFEETFNFFGTVFEPSINTGLNCVRSVSHEMSQSHGGSATRTSIS